MATVKVPANAAAEEVRRRREENEALEEQMRVLRSKQLENSEVLGQLSTLAEWAEVDDGVVEPPVPEPEPEPDPEPVPEPEPEPEEPEPSPKEPDTEPEPEPQPEEGPMMDGDGAEEDMETPRG